MGAGRRSRLAAFGPGRSPELRRPLFVGAVLLYAAAKAWQYGGPHPLPGLVSAYLADLLCLPVVLTLALWAQRRLGPHPPGFVLPDAWLLAAWLYVAVLFEGLLPLLSARYTADGLDVLAYAVGTLAFRRWLNRPA